MENTLFKTMSRDERQEIARVKWIKNKCVGTFEFATGFGKTFTAIKCIKSVINKYPRFKVLIVVPTENLEKQWNQYIDNFQLGLNCNVQIINTIITRSWVCDILVIDEAHRYASDKFQHIFTNVKYRYILGLTATFKRLDGKHELIAKYCPVIDAVTVEEAVKNKWLSEFKEYQVLITVDDIDEYKALNAKFIEHFEFFNYDFDLAKSMIGKYGFINRARYRDAICNPNASNEEKKNVFKQITIHAIGFIRAIQDRKKFISNHPKKIEIARKIIQARQNAKIITFSSNVQMAKSIGYGIVYTGKTKSKKKSQEDLDNFNLQETGVINSCAKLNEGADIKGLSVAIILGLDSSETKSVQRRGRAIRKEENKIAEIFNIVIDQTTETKWFQNSHQNSHYITIDEKGLEDVLEGKEPRLYVKKINDFTFRY